MLDTYENLYGKLFGINETNSTSQNETSFINYLRANKTGLKLLKGSDDMQNWSSMEQNSNGNVIPKNCN